MSELRFCPHCGTPVSPGHLFCVKCGNSTGSAPQASNVYAPPPQAAHPPAPRRKGTVLIVLAALFFVLAVACISVVLIYGPADVNPKELNGQWTMKVMPVTLINAKTDYFSEDDIGKEKAVPMALTLDKTGSGIMDANGTNAAAAYKSGKFVAELSYDPLKMRFDGVVHKDKDGLRIEGSFVYSVTEGENKGDIVRGTWKAILADDEGSNTGLQDKE
jgi:hypothetical protein